VEAVFLKALHADCRDETTWLALADWLEEDGQSERAELVRLVRQLRALPVIRRSHQRVALEKCVAALLAAGVRPVVPEVVNSIGMRLALIPPGRFRMGSPVTEKERRSDETLHEVEITRPFYLGVFPVTQQQYRKVMGEEPSNFARTGDQRDKVKGLKTDDFPVERVSWNRASEFCEKLSGLRKERDAGLDYRLPTEAEWEYSCRGGASSTTAFHFGPSLTSTQANMNGSHPYGGAEKGAWLARTCRVGSYTPNAFGLFDMHGNVWEWCADWYGADYSKKGPRQDPPGPSRGRGRVIRGCGWYNGASGLNCRAALRLHLSISFQSDNVGFRVAANLHL
jgi:uncharacterized protein (TIGR02996 family)